MAHSTMRTVDRIGGAALVLLALAVAWESRRLPLGTLSHPGPGFMPLLLAAIIGGFGILIVSVGGGSAAVSSLGWGEARHAVAILGACVFSALALERIGYRLTMLLVLVFLLALIERKHPLVVGLLSLALSLGSFYLFYDLLRVQLPRGPWGF